MSKRYLEAVEAAAKAGKLKEFRQYEVDNNPSTTATDIKKTPIVPGTHHKPTEQLKDLKALKAASKAITDTGFPLTAKFEKVGQTLSDKIKNAPKSDFAEALEADAKAVSAATTSNPTENAHARTLTDATNNAAYGGQISLVQLFGDNARKNTNFDAATLTANLMIAAKTDDGKTTTGEVGKLITGSKLFYDAGTDGTGDSGSRNFECTLNKLKEKTAQNNGEAAVANAVAATIKKASIFVPGGTLKADDQCLPVSDLLVAYKLFDDSIADNDKFADANEKIVTSVTTNPEKTLKTVDADKLQAYLAASAAFMGQDAVIEKLTAQNAQTGIDATLNTQFKAVVKTSYLKGDKTQSETKNLEKVDPSTSYTCKPADDSAACTKSLSALYKAFCPKGDVDCKTKASNYIDFINTTADQTVAGLMTTETEDFATCHKSLVELDGNWGVSIGECVA